MEMKLTLSRFAETEKKSVQVKNGYKTNPENELIRLQIDNTDNELTEEQVKLIIDSLSRYTSRLCRKYKISNNRFKLITGRSLVEKLFRLA
jgi:hypothetical protein